MNEYKLPLSMVWHESTNLAPLQLWNKEDECHKTQSIIKALTHRKWTSKSTDLRRTTMNVWSKKSSKMSRSKSKKMA
jgi:hypothetical protein